MRGEMHKPVCRQLTAFTQPLYVTLGGTHQARCHCWIHRGHAPPRTARRLSRAAGPGRGHLPRRRDRPAAAASLCRFGAECRQALTRHLWATLPRARHLGAQPIRGIWTVEQRIAEADEGFRGVARFGMLAQCLERGNRGEQGDRVAPGEPRGTPQCLDACCRRIRFLGHEHVEWDQRQWT